MADQPGSTPQFDTAEYSSKPGSNTCRSCHQTIRGPYYRVNGALACPNCAQQLQNQLPKDSQPAFMRALLFGFGAAVLGLILYAVFGIITGWVIGYVSLAVGYIVGKAMLQGSGGIGGRRYQIAAVLFTYFAVSMAAVPVGISQAIKRQNARRQGLIHSSSPNAATNSPAQPENQENVVEDPSPSSAAVDNPPWPGKPKPSLGALLGVLLFAGLASPFLELSNPLHGVIGLIILFVGLQIAWKLTAGKKVDVLGPFGQSAPPAPLG